MFVTVLGSVTHTGLCLLGRQNLRSGPGHSEHEDYLHTEVLPGGDCSCLLLCPTLVSRVG